ncbi:Smr/MutS family protein [Chryseobacterium sp. SNU WT5]|nr:Smr/MutS family protein [Chryseobacterium sp. SNU WT5]
MKVGDLVSVVNDDLKGKIITINNNIVIIEDEHGFPYEFTTGEVVLQEAEIYEKIKTVRKEELSKPVSKKHNKQPFILDLHFEKFTNNPTEIDSFERLFIQKDKLLKTLDYCRQNHLKKLEVIHGIGDGVLQQMVYDVLESQTNIEFHNKEILHHQSGTVMVFFR